MKSCDSEISCTLNSDCGEIRMLMSMVHVMARRAGLSDKMSNRMLLAVDELFANIAEHGYHGREGKVEMCARIHRGALVFELRDYADPFAEACVLCEKPPRLEDEAAISPGGLGLHLMHAVMDDIEHEALADGNRWRLIKQLNKEGEHES